MEKLTDNNLIILAKEGDKKAENTLILRYKNYVEMLSRPYFLVGAEHEDVVQIGMIGLLKAIRHFDDSRDNNFKTYATKCIRNCILDGVREANAKKNQPLSTSFSLGTGTEQEDNNTEIIDILPSPELDPEKQYLAKEATEAFYDALSQTIGETDLAIIKLYLASMPYKEISERLGITSKKVDNTIYNAKKKIEKLLKPKTPIN